MDNNQNRSIITDANSHNKIEQSSLEQVDISIDNFSLYLNIIGGHSLFIEISKTFLLKSASINEISFYERSFGKNSPSLYIPHYIGKILRQTSSYKIISQYIAECKIFFKRYIKAKGFTAEDLNIEKDPKFIETFNSYINSEDNNDDMKINKSFAQLEAELNVMQVNKLKWIVFWFVKWKENFGNYDYIIIENLTYNMECPAILDVKLGSSPRISKDKTIKIFKGATNEIGCRIMGSLKFNTFKNRYDTRNLTLKQFNEELKNFFSMNSTINIDLINKTISILNTIKEEVKEDEKFLMKFSSVLILYDFMKESNLIVKLIDFSYFEEKADSEKYMLIKKDYLQSIDNLIGILAKCK